MIDNRLMIQPPQSADDRFVLNCRHVARYIAAQPQAQHEQLVRQLLAALQRGGVDVELLLCAMDEAQQPGA